MCLGKKRNAQRVLVGKAERDHLQDIGANGRIILKWILKEYNESFGMNSSGLANEKVEETSGYRNEIRFP
jgi:hypothetical protein